MAFIQIIEANTSKWDEMQALVTEYEKSIDGKSTVRRSIVTRDRANPERHIIIVFFDSYESAMDQLQLARDRCVRREAGRAARARRWPSPTWTWSRTARTRRR